MSDRDAVPPPDEFRWQAFFQRSTDPLFLLDRQRRLLFVNRAWETLAGMTAAQVRGLRCRKQKPAAPGETPEDALAHALCPPADVLRGVTGRVRRLSPRARPAADAPRWWDVDFLPLRDERGVRGFLGRITSVAAEEEAEEVPLPERIVALRGHVAGRYGMDWLASDVPAMRRLAEQVRLAAELSAPAVLVGESGSGKCSVARIVHARGAGRERPFAALDCTRLPPDAVAAVLLGGAARGRPGTVYLKHPQCLPRDLQARLLPLLAAPAAPRLLAGFGTPPADEVRAGRLLDDLFAALALLVLEVPPLRERREDLPALVERLLPRCNELGEPAATGLTPAAWDALRHHHWPGNVRELFTALASARPHAANGRIDVDHLPPALRLTRPARPAAERPVPLDELLEQTERRLIELALRRANGKKVRAAELLAIPYPRLFRRMEVLHLGGREPVAELELDEESD